ncbi:small ribosomal subunit protein mS37 [Osmia lignaria lignaria]|uniref:uncharacterized protein LOC117612056 n=1 Tax=Osmia lignaria TaxID=473952 RepID=UPI0014786B3E|nr:uncharacterized protein LOC117612056 [Osmia lignaria]XP_034196624.1 uncharacterized protein LOC117612056 [Osmia lignaria]
MRLNAVYLGKYARSPQSEKKVPFKEAYPLKLQNRVSGRAPTSLQDKCLFEMSLLFNCWKEKEFGFGACNEFELKLQKCYKNLQITMKNQSEQSKKDIPTPETKNFSDKQLTYLLRKYPTI